MWSLIFGPHEERPAPDTGQMTAAAAAAAVSGGGNGDVSVVCVTNNFQMSILTHTEGLDVSRHTKRARLRLLEEGLFFFLFFFSIFFSVSRRKKTPVIVIIGNNLK